MTIRVNNNIDRELYHSKIIQIEGVTYKRMKNPDAPKRPPNAYQLFVCDNRDEILRENSEVNGNSDILKLFSLIWKSLDDATKIVYQERADKLKDSYMKEKEQYTGEKYVFRKCNKKRNHRNNEKKKELTKYNIFLSSEISYLKQEYPEKTHKEIFIMAVRKWNQLSVESVPS